MQFVSFMIKIIMSHFLNFHNYVNNNILKIRKSNKKKNSLLLKTSQTKVNKTRKLNKQLNLHNNFQDIFKLIAKILYKLIIHLIK